MIPVQIVDNALELLKQRYFFLDDSHLGYNQVRKSLGQIAYIRSWDDLKVSHSIYGVDGLPIISGISVVIVKPLSVKGKKFSDYF
jgi:hypothetical protein